MTSTLDDFVEACEYVNAQHSNLSLEVLVRLYGYFKQATVGKCNTLKPLVFDFRARAMWKSWSKLDGISKSQAMQLYVKSLTEAVPNWNQSASCTESKQQGWVSVSTMCKEEDIPRVSEGVFDWVKEGCINKLKECSILTADLRDDQGLTLLHWAADRGHADMVKYLIQELKIDPNCRDNENQTPLHYAAACGHFDVCKLLVDMGADTDAVDNDQLTPKNVAENAAIVDFLFSR